jgi:hypothetical protein
MRHFFMHCFHWGWMMGLLVVTGCTGYSLPPLKLQPSTRIDWVRQGSGVYLDAQERVFYGVGVASGLSNALLLRSSADNQAQKQAADILARFVQTLADSVGDQAAIEPSLYALVQDTMADAVIVDHWQNSQTGQFYALCRLTLAAFKRRLSNDGALDNNMRQAMLSHADGWHARMAR